MPSRETILRKVRSHLPQAVEQPAESFEGINYPDPVAQFTAVLEGVGGRCLPVADLAAVNAALNLMPEYSEAIQRYSAIAGAGETNINLPASGDPHGVEQVDFAAARRRTRHRRERRRLGGHR
ncbi:MAG: hypothetical protein R3B90_23165 [Planctomycetaceae bacterium]